MAIETSESSSGGSPAAAMRRAGEVIVEVAERLPAALADEELVAGVEGVQQVRAALAAVEAILVGEADRREVAKRCLHYGSTQDWYTHVAGAHRRDGFRAVRHARALTSDYPDTLEAMLAGSTSPAQAAVICDALDRLPGYERARTDGERLLNEQAKVLTASELLKAARHLVSVVDPEGEERRAERELDREERAAHRERFLSVTDDGRGGVRVKGWGSVEDAVTIRAALLPLTKPAPAADLDHSTCDPERDPRDHGARMWDALVQVAQHSLDTELPPESHGARPRVSVLVGLDDLRGAGGSWGLTEDGLDLSAATIRRLACDADLIPICLGTRGEVLDVGRSSRLVTPALWRAIVVRDRHCRFPGCTRPPVMGHAHHIRHWVHGGDTKLENLVLLCGEHHRVIHHTPWQVRLSPVDAHAEFLPPPRRRDMSDQPRSWIRHRPRRE